MKYFVRVTKLVTLWLLFNLFIKSICGWPFLVRTKLFWAGDLVMKHFVRVTKLVTLWLLFNLFIKSMCEWCFQDLTKLFWVCDLVMKCFWELTNLVSFCTFFSISYQIPLRMTLSGWYKGCFGYNTLSKTILIRVTKFGKPLIVVHLFIKSICAWSFLVCTKLFLAGDLVMKSFVRVTKFGNPWNFFSISCQHGQNPLKMTLSGWYNICFGCDILIRVYQIW